MTDEAYFHNIKFSNDFRHRKSIFGKGFSGTIINTEFSHAYRGCMYLEVLVTVCLYYARSFFHRECIELNKLPTTDDIGGNCKIQLAAIELLTMLCTELIVIVKEMGKGLACYIADLMAKCKLQKVRKRCRTVVVILLHFCRIGLFKMFLQF